MSSASRPLFIGPALESAGGGRGAVVLLVGEVRIGRRTPIDPIVSLGRATIGHVTSPAATRP